MLMTNLISQKSEKISGSINVPGDKSISHRALILGSCAMGCTKITNMLESEDIMSTINALNKLGVKIEKNKFKWNVYGNGLGSVIKKNVTVDLGNSGTSARLLMGLVSGCDAKVRFIGDESLLKRPMKRIIDPLRLSGAQIVSNYNTLPIEIVGSKIPMPIDYSSSLSSAQVKSAVLLCGLHSTGYSIFKEPHLSRDHTERMLKFMGADIECLKTSEGSYQITLKGLPNLKCSNIEVPNDPSSAAFPVVSALLIPESKVIVKNVCINELRFGLYQTLIEMGANIKIYNKRSLCGEEVADIEAKHSSLKGVKIPLERVPTMIDEFPILSVAASFATGETIMEGVGDLRYKESDRIEEIENNFKRLGILTKSTKNSLKVFGRKQKFLEGGIQIDPKLDHRIAMSFICLGFMCRKPINIKNANTINSSFPDFFNIMKKIGANIKLL